MDYPPMVEGLTTAQYRERFEQVYCRGPIMTFDGIRVRFAKRQFDHCFFESTQRDQNKDAFSDQRALRIDWIKAALGDHNACLRQGYDKKKKRWDTQRRVALVQGNYVVVICLVGKNRARFVTAFVANENSEPGHNLSTVNKIRMGPPWA